MPRVTRRKFIASAATAGAVACACGLSSCATFSKKGSTKALDAGTYVIEKNIMTIDLSKVPVLEKVGGSVKVFDAKLPQPVIIARTGDAEYAVVSIKCPHRGVEVEYRHGEKQFRCASLGHSTFGSDGAYRKGLAKKALAKYLAKLDPSDKNRLIVALSSGCICDKVLSL